jgi:hypothetical protein
MQNSIMRYCRRPALLLLMALAVALAGGCTAIRFGYNNGETLVYWWLDRYIDTRADQRPWVQQRISDLLQWHRRTQLPDYAVLLASMQQQLQRPVARHDVEAMYEQGKRYLVTSIEHALPDLATLALSLQPGQIARLERKFAANNDKYRRDYLSGDVERRQRFRYEKTIERAEYWFGEFSPEQRALIRRASDARPLHGELRLAHRQQRQQALVALLSRIQSERPSHAQAVTLLRDHVAMVFEQDGSDESAQFYRGIREQMFGLAVEIINCTTPAQKAHATKRLQQWIDDFHALAAPGPNRNARKAEGAG